METKHTPTPWKATTTATASMDTAYEITGPQMQLIATTSAWRNKQDEVTANAAFIVRAVNEYETTQIKLQYAETYCRDKDAEIAENGKTIDALMKALELAEQHDKDLNWHGKAPNGDDYNTVMESLGAALALARGEA